MRKYIPILIFAIVLLSSLQELTSQSFTDIEVNLPTVSLGSVVWGDYDNDGDLDYLYTSSSTGYPTQLARHDGNDNFTMVSTNFISFRHGEGAWGDYDNDGDLDIALTGETDNIPTTKIYRNDGWGFFMDINAELIGVTNSTLDWGDYNNDGRLDLIVSGISENDEPLATLYKNDSSGIFTDSEISITPCTNGSVQWGDFDNDELLDLLLLGQDYNGNSNTEIYRNTGNDEFVSINAGFPRVYKGNADFGDYDADGDLDVVMCGYGTNGSIYKNNGDGTFSDIDAGMEELSSKSAIKWGDYDSDGDLDIFFSGLNNKNGVGETKIYTNEGSDVFSEASTSFVGLFNSKISIGDYDSDNDVDLLLTGNDDVLFTGVYRNDASQTNTKPSAPLSGFQSQVINNGAILSWDPGSDAETPAVALTYNIQLDSVQGGINIVSPMADLLTGNRRIPQAGNAGSDTEFFIQELPVGTYHWRVQSIDGSNKASAFSNYQSFDVIPTLTLVKEEFLPLKESCATFGDYNNDGYQDFIMCGEDFPRGNLTKIYKNNGDNTFDTINVNLPGVYYGSLSWGDYDNDADLDLFLCGNAAPRYSSAIRISRIYRNDGSDVFTDINAGISGSTSCDSEWADIDNDGDLDLAVVGSHTGIYRNDGNDIFTNINPGVFGSGSGNLGFGDIDNDYDLDLIITGYSSTIWKNEGNCVFSKYQENIFKHRFGDIEFNDFSNDGDLDMLLIGAVDDLNTTSIYENDEGVFNDLNLGFRGAASSSVFGGDFNNDGYLDVLYSGYSGAFITKLYLNDQFGAYNDQNLDMVTGWPYEACGADIDNDADLDILIISAGTDSTRMYLNNMNFPKIIPESPQNLSSKNSGLGIILNWDPPSNFNDGEWNLSYNVRMGTSPGSADIISPMTVTPTSTKRLITQMGNAQTNLGWRIDSLAVGDYFWSVQAIDHSYYGGNWANEVSFTITQMRPYFSASIACLGTASTFTDNTIVTGTEVASWAWDFGDGNSSTFQHPDHVYELAGEYPVQLSVTDTSGVTLSTSEIISVLPVPEADFGVSNICIGSLASVVNISNTDTLSIDSWLWDYGDGSTSSEFSPPPYGYLTTGSYDIKLTISAHNGCVDILSKEIEVVEYPVSNIGVGGNAEFCEGKDVKLIVPENGNYDYQWKIGGNIMAGADSSVYFATQTGNYTVSVTNQVAGCNSESLSPVSVIVVQSPTPPFIQKEGSLDFCDGDNVELSVSYFDGYTYEWKLNGGAVGTNSNIYLAEDPGSYTVDVYNSTGCLGSSIDPVIVTVYDNPLIPTVNVNGPTAFCLGQSVDLGVDFVSGMTYQWMDEDVNVLGATSNTYAAEASGDYKLRITNGDNCISETQVVIVIADPAPTSPTIGYSGELEFCDTDSLVLRVADYPNYTYEWLLNGGTVGSNSSSYAARASGDYQVKVQNLGDCFAMSANTVTLTVHGSPASPTLNQSGPSTFCEDGSLTLSVAEPGTDNYQWLSELGEMTDETGTSITVDESGLYRVRVRNAGMCEAFSQEIAVTVNEYPGEPMIQTDNYTAGDCQNEDPVILSVQSPENNVLYQWSRDGNTISGAIQDSYSGYLEEGSYKVSADNTGCIVESESQLIDYAEMPEKPEIIAEGPTIWYLACTNDSATAYKWYLNGLQIEGADEYLYVAGTEEGKFEVAISENGSCFSMSDPLWIPLGTGIDLNPWENLKIYPNPTPGLFTLEMDNHLMGELIIDIFGESGAQIINIKFQKETAHFKTQIDLSGQPAAAYLIGLMLEEYRTNRTLIVE